MSKREFFVIVCAAIALAIALPFMAQWFQPRQAEPEPLPGVPFSTTPVDYQPPEIVPVEPPKEPVATVIRGRVMILHTETPVGATIEWYIERSNGGDVVPTQPATIQADEKGCFAIVLPPVKSPSRFLIRAKAVYYEFESANDAGRWQDSGTEGDFGVIQMLAYSRVNVVWKGQQDLDLTGETVAFRRTEKSLVDATELVPARIGASGLAKARLGYGRWAMWLVPNQDRRVAKTLLPFVRNIEIVSPLHEFTLETLCVSGNSTLTASAADTLGGALEAKLLAARVGPGETTGIVASGFGRLEVRDLPAGIYELTATKDGKQASRRVFLAEGVRHEVTVVLPAEPRLELQILRKGKAVVGAQVGPAWGHMLITNTEGKVTLAGEGQIARIGIQLPREGSGQFTYATRPIHGWGDQSSRVIELEPEGSVSLLVDPRFHDVGRGSETLLITDWSQHVHLRALAPFSDIDEYRWADHTRGFKFIGLSRGQYLLETTEYFSCAGEKRQNGPWSQLIDLSDPARDRFEFNDVIPTHSFDCLVRNDGPPLTEIARCTVWRADSDLDWHQRRRELQLDLDGTLHVRDLTAGRWIMSADAKTDFGWVGFVREFHVSTTGIEPQLAFGSSEIGGSEAPYWRTTLRIEAEFPSFGKPRTDGLLTLYSLGGVPLKSWVTGTRFKVGVEGITPGCYWCSFVSPTHIWQSKIVLIQPGTQNEIGRNYYTGLIHLGLTMKNIEFTDSSGAYLENEDGYQPRCTLEKRDDGISVWAEYVPCTPTMYLCLGDGRRIALDLGAPPLDYHSRHFTLDLKTR